MSSSSSYASSASSRMTGTSHSHSHTTTPTEHNDPLTPTPPTPPQPTSPSIRGPALHLPLHLPQPPKEFEEVDVTQLLLDEDLKDVPVGFFVERLRTMGPLLLRACASTHLVLHLSLTKTPPSLPYVIQTFDETLDEVTRKATIPTHILAVKAPDLKKILLFPLHGLIWASKSPRLGVLSKSSYEGDTPEEVSPDLPLPSTGTGMDETSRNATEPWAHGNLPVIELNLPSAISLPLLQGYLYLTTDAAPHLLRSLLPPSAAPHLALETSTASSISQAISFLDSEVLLGRIRLIHSLWQNVVALEIGDRELWETMSLAWTIVVGAVGVGEKRRREGMGGTQSGGAGVLRGSRSVSF